MTPTRSLQEVVFAAHFAEPLPVRTADLASWISEFGGSNANYQELPPLPPASVPIPGQAPQFASVALFGDAAASPRVRISGSDQHDVSVLQGDRVAFGWQRNIEVGVEAMYPGYEVLKGCWRTELRRFSDWAFDRFSQRISPRLVEISYNNAFLLKPDGRTRRLAEICTLIRPGMRPVNSMQLAWSELVDSGRGSVQANAGIGTAPGGLPIFGINYFGLINIRHHGVGGEMDAILDDVDMLHDHILKVHEAAVEEGVR